jgi:predicted CopG family antitoxin
MVQFVLLISVKTQITKHQQKYKTLHVTFKTYAELEKLGTFKGSFDDVIQMLLQTYEAKEDNV